MLKLVESNHYHIWTDALHARALAHEAVNKWDRGTYVRWTVMTAWTALEVACHDAMNVENNSRQFRKYLDNAINQKSLPSIDWGTGIWQKVTDVQKLRNGIAHPFKYESDLFPDASVADKVIITIREAIATIYEHVGANSPYWIKDDVDNGWAGKGGMQGGGFAHQIPPGLDENAPDTIRITILHKENENPWLLLFPDDDYISKVDDIIDTIEFPINAVRVYRGKELILEKTLEYNIDMIRGVQ